MGATARAQSAEVERAASEELAGSTAYAELLADELGDGLTFAGFPDRKGRNPNL